MTSVVFAGMEAFDIVLYISGTAVVLGRRIMIIDLSDTGAIAKVIHQGMGMDSSKDIVHYRGIDYMQRIPRNEELEEFEEGVVFTVCGFNFPDSLPFRTDILNIVTDSMPSCMDRITGLICLKTADDSIVDNIIVRDVITEDDYERVIRSLNGKSNYMYLYHDASDYENALRCQLKQTVRFDKISAAMKRVVIKLTGDIFPDIKPSVIRKAFMRARKGA